MGRSRLLGRRLGIAVVGVTVGFGSIACSAHQSAAPPTSAPPSTSDQPAAVELSGTGTLAQPGQSSNAFTYDPALAPVGAKLTVTLTPSDGATVSKLVVSGLLPNRGYAAHLHAKPCGSTGAAAGPHFQYQIDPAATPDKPSTDPKYANPGNEVWLDVQTDATGAGTSTDKVPFVFTDRVPASLVLHKDMKTATKPGEAGKAGDRVACFTLPTR